MMLGDGDSESDPHHRPPPPRQAGYLTALRSISGTQWLISSVMFGLIVLLLHRAATTDYAGKEYMKQHGASESQIKSAFGQAAQEVMARNQDATAQILYLAGELDATNFQLQQLRTAFTEYLNGSANATAVIAVIQGTHTILRRRI